MLRLLAALLVGFMLGGAAVSVVAVRETGKASDYDWLWWLELVLLWPLSIPWIPTRKDDGDGSDDANE